MRLRRESTGGCICASFGRGHVRISAQIVVRVRYVSGTFPTSKSECFSEGENIGQRLTAVNTPGELGGVGPPRYQCHFTSYTKSRFRSSGLQNRTNPFSLTYDLCRPRNGSGCAPGLYSRNSEDLTGLSSGKS